MNHMTPTALAFMLAVAPSLAIACGEGVFNVGEGLRYQGYLAPRPATVLIYDPTPGERRRVYIGLHKAGHRLTVVHNEQELAQALKDQRYDVAITAFALRGALESAAPGGSPRLLPVIPRQQRNTPDIRSRFAVFLLEDASLGQYLKGIDQLVKGIRP